MQVNLLFFLLSIISLEQVTSYYNSIDFTTSPLELEAQLTSLVQSTHHTQLRYTPQVWEAVMETDVNPENIKEIILLYGSNNQDEAVKNDRMRDITLRCDFSGDCTGLWNREHVYPRSLGKPKLGFENAGADVHAIRASDVSMNAWRKNRKFAAGVGDAKITPQGHFYPGDEWKGDVARMMMYMYLRYPNQCNPKRVAYEKDKAAVMPYIFLQWNAEDPPSQLEIRRNDIIANKYQGNRNPFIDNPYLASILWGGAEASNTWGDFLFLKGNKTTFHNHLLMNEKPLYQKIHYKTYIVILLFLIRVHGLSLD